MSKARGENGAITYSISASAAAILDDDFAEDAAILAPDPAVSVPAFDVWRTCRLDQRWRGGTAMIPTKRNGVFQLPVNTGI